MKIKDMTLEQWQEKMNEYNRQNVGESGPCAMRCDGTQFSVGAMYGGFTFNGATYTCFYFQKEGNAVIGVREDFLRWLKKDLKKVVSK